MNEQAENRIYTELATADFMSVRFARKVQTVMVNDLDEAMHLMEAGWTVYGDMDGERFVGAATRRIPATNCIVAVAWGTSVSEIKVSLDAVEAYVHFATLCGVTVEDWRSKGEPSVLLPR